MHLLVKIQMFCTISILTTYLDEPLTTSISYHQNVGRIRGFDELEFLFQGLITWNRMNIQNTCRAIPV